MDDVKRRAAAQVHQTRLRISGVTGGRDDAGAPGWPSTAKRIQSAVDALKRHPTAATSAAIGTALGVIIGRATRRP